MLSIKILFELPFFGKFYRQNSIEIQNRRQAHKYRGAIWNSNGVWHLITFWPSINLESCHQLKFINGYIEINKTNLSLSAGCSEFADGAFSDNPLWTVYHFMYRIAHTSDYYYFILRGIYLYDKFKRHISLQVNLFWAVQMLIFGYFPIKFQQENSLFLIKPLVLTVRSKPFGYDN